MDKREEERIVELFKEDNWMEILRSYKENKFLPWIWPEVKNLDFIGECVREKNATGIVSIGCGSGLLEWLINRATGIPVTGVELDSSWWTSKYVDHIFIPMVFTENSTCGHKAATASDVVLMFCYFNNGNAFLDYIDNFRGTCFIVIGPGEGRQTHTDPEPFFLPQETLKYWKLSGFQEIRDSKDFIAVYHRSSLN